MTPVIDSPQIRLAASREALVRQMTGECPSTADGPDRDANDSLRGADAGGNAQDSSTWQFLKQAVMAWWQHHLAQLAVDLGQPLLNNYARDKPFQLLAIAAGAGAIAVLIKPWRLVSITGLAMAALKSTGLSSTLLSLIPRGDTPRPPKKTQLQKETP
jgi:hypothetical protein